jgi:hypothetical protein
MASIVLLRGLIFYPEDGSDKFHRNVVAVFRTARHKHPENRTVHSCFVGTSKPKYFVIVHVESPNLPSPHFPPAPGVSCILSEDRCECECR